MINFRFHLVSLVAVFLALALGVVVGSTVIDRAIVDGLRSRIDHVEKKANDQRKENGDLKKELSRVTAYADQASPYTVERRLADVAVSVLAVRGVNGDSVRATMATLRQAGARASGVVWLEPRWALKDEADRQRLRQALGSNEVTPEGLRAAGLRALTERLVAGGVGGGGAAGDALVALRDAGFVSLDGAGTPDPDPGAYPGPNVRVVVIDSADGQVPAPELSLPMIRDLAVAGVPVVSGEAPTDPAAALVSVPLVQGDAALARQVPSVDDLDVVEGRVALVLVLQRGAKGLGHYGRGPGASRQLPEPPAP